MGFYWAPDPQFGRRWKSLNVVDFALYHMQPLLTIKQCRDVIFTTFQHCQNSFVIHASDRLFIPPGKADGLQLPGHGRNLAIDLQRDHAWQRLVHLFKLIVTAAQLLHCRFELTFTTVDLIHQRKDRHCVGGRKLNDTREPISCLGGVPLDKSVFPPRRYGL
ncbi:hypothetical protein D3C79_734420 [compost metagenome]